MRILFCKVILLLGVAVLYGDQLDPSTFHVHRNNLQNCRYRFETAKKGRVAFLGGSITHNPGWRDMVCEYLQNRFPETEFEFINAGIPSTGSVPGAFRLERDVLSRGPIDLLFEEAAVNDATNGRSATAQVRGMEGIVRHALEANPLTDIVLLYFVDPDKMADYNRGLVPEVIRNHERVAQYYQVSALNLALEVTERIRAGEFTWEEDFINLHPSPFGQKVYFNSIKAFLDSAWSGALPDRQHKHVLPGEPLDPFSYTNGRLAGLEKAALSGDWTRVNKWRPRDAAGTRAGFVDVPALVAEKPGSELEYQFEGTAVGIFVAAGPDAGILEYRIDGGPPQTLDQFTCWSAGLHLPWLYILADELGTGPHSVTIKTTDQKNPGSVGYACRIFYFAIN